MDSYQAFIGIGLVDGTEAPMLNIDYLDMCIWILRRFRSMAEAESNKAHAQQWSYYIDAYQSVRVSHGLMPLPAEPAPTAEQVNHMATFFDNQGA